MDSVAALFVAILTLVSAHLNYVVAVPGIGLPPSVRAIASDPNAHAATTCSGHTPTVYLDASAVMFVPVIEHEMLHAIDCMDDGLFNGSPEPDGCHPAKPPYSTDCAHSWVYWAFANPVAAQAVIDTMPR